MNKELFDKGLAVRKEVLGKEYVENSLKSADEFMMAFQEITTEYCWGYVWDRPGLDRKTRSMLNLAMLSALNRGPELRLHINGALNNGVTRRANTMSPSALSAISAVNTPPCSPAAIAVIEKD